MLRHVLSGLLLGLFAVSPPVSAYDLPFCDDWLVVESEADIVTAVHMGGEYNCCPDHFEYSVELVEDRIEIIETEILPDDICVCMCCWNTTVAVEDVPPGDWLVHFHYWDNETGMMAELVGSVHVGGSGQGAAFAVLDNWDSGCLAIGTSAQEGFESSSWGRVKALWK